MKSLKERNEKICAMGEEELDAYSGDWNECLTEAAQKSNFTAFIERTFQMLNSQDEVTESILKCGEEALGLTAAS